MNASDWLPGACHPEKGRSIYKIEFPDGYGKMTVYSVLPGIQLIFNDFHTHYGFQEEHPHPGYIEINHCLRGRYECTMPDGRHIYLGTQDFSVSDMGVPNRASSFVMGEYVGLSLVIHTETASQSINAFLEEEIGCIETFEQLLWEENVMILRANPKIQHIVSELYDAPASGQKGYYKLKTLELLCFLIFQCQQRKPVHPYYCRKDSSRMEAIQRKMTENLRYHYCLSDLAEEYGISLTTLKKRFFQVYGETPYQYLKRRRLEEAALLLQTTEMGIGQIAEAVGYQNPSKFSAAFAEYYGVPPREYKKGVLLDG